MMLNQIERALFSEKSTRLDQVHALGDLECIPPDKSLPFFYEKLVNNRVPVRFVSPMLGMAGSGGTGLNTVNITTPSAYICSLMGLLVIKHGNRGVTSPSGSSDIAQCIGFSQAKNPCELMQHIKNRESCFLHAPDFHPLLGKIQLARKKYGKRTIFNALGPILNPARPSHMIIGQSDPKMLYPIGRLLTQVEHIRCAYVVHCAGLDEFSTHGINQYVDVNDGYATEKELDVTRIGLKPGHIRSLAGGSPGYNLLKINEALTGKASALKDIILLNSTMGLKLMSKKTAIEALLARTEHFIENRRATDEPA